MHPKDEEYLEMCRAVAGTYNAAELTGALQWAREQARGFASTPAQELFEAEAKIYEDELDRRESE